MFVVDWYLTLIARFMGNGIDGSMRRYFKRDLDTRMMIGGFFAFLPLIIFLQFTNFDVSKHPNRYFFSLLAVIFLAFGPLFLLYLRRKQIMKRVKKSKPVSFWRGVAYIVIFFAAWWLLDWVRHTIFG